MPAAINEIQPITNEIVLQERVATTEFVITEIHESIVGGFVGGEVGLGPCTQDNDIRGGRRGAGRRGVPVWRDQAYDAIRDTWTNTDLVAEVTAIMNAS